ncbi:MAG: hypothetical protein ABSH13_17125 [Candidatus Acidiferrum sp.]
MTAQIALSIDALNGETGHVLHRLLPPAAPRGTQPPANAFPTKKNKTLPRIVLPAHSGVKKKRHNM